MNILNKEAAISIINNKIANIHRLSEDFYKAADIKAKECLEHIQNCAAQIPNAKSGLFIPKTPKVPRKKDAKRIDTIPEGDVIEHTDRSEASTISVVEDIQEKEERNSIEARPSRIKRAASQKAAKNIKEQQSLGVGAKLRRPSDEETAIWARPARPSRAKRTISVAESSDDEETKRPRKHVKADAKLPEHETSSRMKKKIPNPKPIVESDSSDMLVDDTLEPERIQHTSTKLSREKPSQVAAQAKKKSSPIDEIMEIGTTDVTVENSMYEDAVGKSIPMNSTMNPNTTVTIDRKMMNATVVLESIQYAGRMNETVTIVRKDGPSNPNSGRNTLVGVQEEVAVASAPSVGMMKHRDGTSIPGSPRAMKSIFQAKMTLQEKMRAIKETAANDEFDALITDDESSPERRSRTKTVGKRNSGNKDKKQAKRFTRSSLLSEDGQEDLQTAPIPSKSVLRDMNAAKNLKTAYKPNALFSPYSKESVKKRVEAFEQAGLNSPKVVDIDAPTRQTRTKTRAMAAAEAGSNLNVESVAQKLARKSLAKAKKISLSRAMKENEELKQINGGNSAQKPNRLLGMNEKLTQKTQPKTTPMGKYRLQTPLSMNRFHLTPATGQTSNLQQSKPLTASKTNIVTSVNSFIAPAKSITKSNSCDNLAEKRRKMNDEDVRRKKEEALKAASDEKRRKREEKELKNKLAREAKEKLDMERRIKLEKEREEKAKAAALIMQEKQREEYEKKKLLQLQRTQEKEERRRLEEQLRLQRLQEQEEAERQLAEQKRREQEAERRKMAELRAQQAAAAEAAKIKSQYLAKSKQANGNQVEPNSYILDSEPDDGDSDDENCPKHAIPFWAKPSIRQTQLTIQQYIPMKVVLTFFGSKSCTPDLTKIFKGIKKERLQRTSSANWKTPPRYSIMSTEH